MTTEALQSRFLRHRSCFPSVDISRVPKVSIALLWDVPSRIPGLHVGAHIQRCYTGSEWLHRKAQHPVASKGTSHDPL